jgi:hypothetical protein
MSQNQNPYYLKNNLFESSYTNSKGERVTEQSTYEPNKKIRIPTI